MTREWSIQEIARVAGTTSRTLRHYGQIGLLPASRIGANGYRYYDQAALLRLQRILLLRELGLGLEQIGQVLAAQTDEEHALRGHLAWLREEQERLERQVAAVESTLGHLQRKENIMAETMFDGFDHTRYKEEVTERWGAEAYAAGDRWWRGLDAGDRDAWKQRVVALNRDWIALTEAGADPEGAEAQAVAARHVDWLRGVPGTPAAAPATDIRAYVTGLGEMYVADPRFAANYGGQAGAAFVRDALRAYAESRL